MAAVPLLEFAEDVPQLKKEYSDFLKKVDIDDSDSSKATITTKEGATLEIMFSGSGWTILTVEPETSDAKKLEGETYEGCEALLMAASPEFHKNWHDRLAVKLRALTQD